MVGDEGLNVLFNNAGVLHSVPFGQVTAEQMRASYDVNTIGPLMITQVSGIQGVPIKIRKVLSSYKKTKM